MRKLMIMCVACFLISAGYAAAQSDTSGFSMLVPVIFGSIAAAIWGMENLFSGFLSSGFGDSATGRLPEFKYLQPQNNGNGKSNSGNGKNNGKTEASQVHAMLAQREARRREYTKRRTEKENPAPVSSNILWIPAQIEKRPTQIRTEEEWGEVPVAMGDVQGWKIVRVKKVKIHVPKKSR